MWAIIIALTVIITWTNMITGNDTNFRIMTGIYPLREEEERSKSQTKKQQHEDHKALIRLTQYFTFIALCELYVIFVTLWRMHYLLHNAEIYQDYRQW